MLCNSKIPLSKLKDVLAGVGKFQPIQNGKVFMFKKILISGLIGLMISLVLFYQSFFLWTSKWILDVYTSHYFGESLAYEQMIWDGDQFVVLQPRLKQQKFLIADSLAFTWTVNWQTRQLDIFLKVNRPIWKLQQIPLKPSSWNFLLSKESFWLHPSIQWNIQDGIIQWMTPEATEQTFNFDLSLDSLKGVRLVGRFNASKSNHNAFSLEAFNTAKATQIQWHSQALEGKDCFQLLTHFFPTLNEWLVEKGTIEGNFKALFPVDQNLQIQLFGEVILENWLFFYSPQQIQTDIGLAVLKFDTQSVKLNSQKDPSCLGELSLLSATQVTCLTDKAINWALKEIQGRIYWDSLKELKIDLDGQAKSTYTSSPVKLQGEIALPFHQLPNFYMNMHCHFLSSPTNFLHVWMHRPLGLPPLTEIQCHQLSPTSLNFLQAVISPAWPWLKQVQVLNGRLNASMDIEYAQAGFETLKCQTFQTEDLEFKFLPWNTIFSTSTCTGKGSANLYVENLLDSVNADIYVQDGQIYKEADKEGGQAFTHIQAHLPIRQGRLLPTQLTLQYATLKGTAEIREDTYQKGVVISLEGKGQDIEGLVPKPWSRLFKHSLKDHHVRVMATLNPQDKLSVEGEVALIDCLDPSCAMHADFIGKRAWNQSAIEGEVVIKQLSLEPFLSLFLFPQAEAHLRGKGDFKIHFNENHLKIAYDLYETEIENAYFKIGLEELESSIKLLPGEYQLDLKTQQQAGQLGIKRAIFLEKQTGLSFDGIQTVASLQQGALHLQNLKGNCQGIQFAGNLKLEDPRSQLGSWHVDLTLPFLKGNIQQAQHFLARYFPSHFILKIPLEGEIESQQEGLRVKLEVLPNDFRLYTCFKGTIIDGKWLNKERHLILQDLCMDVSYEDQKLAFTNIQGALLAGHSFEAEEYIVTGKHFYLNGLDQPTIDMDVSIHQLNHPLIRCVGCTSNQEKGKVNVHVDKELSHVLQIYPTDFNLILDGQGAIQSFNLSTQLQLATIWKELKLLGQASPFLPNVFMQRLDLLQELKGKAALALQYNPLNNSLKYSLTGKHIQWGVKEFEELVLIGTVKESRWQIDQFQIGDLSLCADFQTNETPWKLNCLGINYENSLIIGLQGIFDEERSLLNTKIQMFELIPSKLTQGNFLYNLAKHIGLEEKVRGKGDLKVHFLAKEPWYAIDTLRLVLDEGIYYFKQHPYRLKDIQINWQPTAVNFSMLSLEKDLPLAIQGWVRWPNLDQGCTTFKDYTSQLNKDFSPLQVLWKTDLEQRVCIQSMQGYYNGMHFDLNANSNTSLPPSWCLLEGEVKVDGNQWERLNLDFICHLQGKCWFNPNSESSILDSIYMKGKFLKEGTLFKGEQVQHLQGDFSYMPGHIKIKDLNMHSSRGEFICPQMNLTRRLEEEDWTLNLSHLIGKNIRPSLLREDLTETFLIRRLELKDFSGILSDPQTWLGQGYLHFLNPSKKETGNSFSAAFTEIKMSVGFNLQVLNPVTGTIYFDLKEGRFYFTKFKDVYSEGRGAKFYLVEEDKPSWLDLKGNLYMHLGVKQTHLMPKMAELFTVRIQGHLKKPEYEFERGIKHFDLPLKIQIK